MKRDSEPELPIEKLDAVVRKIFISSGHDYWGKKGEGRLASGIDEVESAECVAGSGIVGDRYFKLLGGHKGQITFFDENVFLDIRKRFKIPKLPASVFRRNILVSGIDLADWINRRFEIQGVTFEGSQECTPCEWMSRAVAPGVKDFMKENFRGGLRAKILSDGVLRIGD